MGGRFSGNAYAHLQHGYLINLVMNLQLMDTLRKSILSCSYV
jgi:hypothetical protein